MLCGKDTAAAKDQVRSVCRVLRQRAHRAEENSSKEVVHHHTDAKQMSCGACLPRKGSGQSLECGCAIEAGILCKTKGASCDEVKSKTQILHGSPSRLRCHGSGGLARYVCISSSISRRSYLYA